jgi:para-nitrobenzyl esterase
MGETSRDRDDLKECANVQIVFEPAISYVHVVGTLAHIGPFICPSARLPICTSVFLSSHLNLYMKSIAAMFCLALVSTAVMAQLTSDKSLPTVKTANGLLQGTQLSGISMFKGVPYAQPPTGDLRWKEPQPVKNWEGTRRADHFSARAMQLPIYSDMNFRSAGVSEDCLYLNIWTPAKTGKEELPVLVYFYGGGLKAGDGSEYRYDGESMARRGIVAVTVNYRLGVFGFLAHPELTRESAHHASGNYGYMDQTEALRWIHNNIAAFGGNPDNVTIAGESAGSSSVSAQIISPLPRNLFSAAIGESGSVLGMKQLPSLADAEKNGQRFGDSIGAHSIAELRAMSAQQILQATAAPGISNFPVDVDGYFFPEQPLSLYKTGKVAHVPLLVGWNSEEDGWKKILGNEQPTKENYTAAVRKLYPSNADEILKRYVVSNDSDVEITATSLASDRFIAFNTWMWADLHAKTNSPVYRYFFTKPRPALRSQDGTATAATPESDKTAGYFKGAVHSAEIEYALGNLPTNRLYDWQPDDYMISAIMQDYFLNFIKNKNPNGLGLPYWPIYQSWQPDPVQYIGVETHREAEKTRDRYLYLEKLSQ